MFCCSDDGNDEDDGIGLSLVVDDDDDVVANESVGGGCVDNWNVDDSWGFDCCCCPAVAAAVLVSHLINDHFDEARTCLRTAKYTMNIDIVITRIDKAKGMMTKPIIIQTFP